MNYKKIEQTTIYDDIYFLETLGSNIITNDSYKGLSLYSNGLKLIKQIPIFENFVVDRCYKNIEKNELLIFCDEARSLIWINMNTFSHSVISLDNLDSDLYFTPLFEWRNETIILISYSQEAFECNLLKKSIEKISKKTFLQEYSKLFAYWTISIEYQSFYFFNKQHVLIVDNEGNNVLIVDNKGTVKKNIPCSNLNFHDIILFNHIICFISDAGIQLINVENHKKIVIDPEKKHDFFRARFLESDDFFKLVTLSGNNQKLGSDSILTTYQIDLSNPNH